MPEAKKTGVETLLETMGDHVKKFGAVPFHSINVKDYTIGRCVEVTEDEKKSIEKGKWQEESLEKVCTECGKEYYKHPTVVGFKWLHKLCNGGFVKL